MKICYVPLGTRCSSAFIIRDNFKTRTESLPFDWLDMPINALPQFVKLQPDEVDPYVDEYFLNVGTVAHKYEDTEFFAYNRHIDGTWFAHDIEFVDGAYRLRIDTKAKFARRLKRLTNILNDNDCFFIFLTVMYETGMYGVQDYDEVKKILHARTASKSLFITVNLDNEEDFQKENHWNFKIPQLDHFDDGLKGWESLIFNRINNNIQKYIEQINKQTNV